MWMDITILVFCHILSRSSSSTSYPSFPQFFLFSLFSFSHLLLLLLLSLFLLSSSSSTKVFSIHYCYFRAILMFFYLVKLIFYTLLFLNFQPQISICFFYISFRSSTPVFWIFLCFATVYHPLIFLQEAWLLSSPTNKYSLFSVTYIS